MEKSLTSLSLPPRGSDLTRRQGVQNLSYERQIKSRNTPSNTPIIANKRVPKSYAEQFRLQAMLREQTFPGFHRKKITPSSTSTLNNKDRTKIKSPMSNENDVKAKTTQQLKWPQNSYRNIQGQKELKEVEDKKGNSDRNRLPRSKAKITHLQRQSQSTSNTSSKIPKHQLSKMGVGTTSKKSVKCLCEVKNTVQPSTLEDQDADIVRNVPTRTLLTSQFDFLPDADACDSDVDASVNVKSRISSLSENNDYSNDISVKSEPSSVQKKCETLTHTSKNMTSANNDTEQEKLGTAKVGILCERNQIEFQSKTKNGNRLTSATPSTAASTNIIPTPMPVSTSLPHSMNMHVNKDENNNDVQVVTSSIENGLQGQGGNVPIQSSSSAPVPVVVVMDEKFENPQDRKKAKSNKKEKDKIYRNRKPTPATTKPTGTKSPNNNIQVCRNLNTTIRSNEDTEKSLPNNESKVSDDIKNNSTESEQKQAPEKKPPTSHQEKVGDFKRQGGSSSSSLSSSSSSKKTKLTNSTSVNGSATKVSASATSKVKTNPRVSISEKESAGQKLLKEKTKLVTSKHLKNVLSSISSSAGTIKASAIEKTKDKQSIEKEKEISSPPTATVSTTDVSPATNSCSKESKANAKHPKGQKAKSDLNTRSRSASRSKFQSQSQPRQGHNPNSIKDKEIKPKPTALISTLAAARKTKPGDEEEDQKSKEKQLNSNDLSKRRGTKRATSRSSCKSAPIPKHKNTGVKDALNSKIEETNACSNVFEQDNPEGIFQIPSNEYLQEQQKQHVNLSKILLLYPAGNGLTGTLRLTNSSPQVVFYRINSCTTDRYSIEPKDGKIDPNSRVLIKLSTEAMLEEAEFREDSLQIETVMTSADSSSCTTSRRFWMNIPASRIQTTFTSSMRMFHPNDKFFRNCLMHSNQLSNSKGVDNTYRGEKSKGYQKTGNKTGAKGMFMTSGIADVLEDIRLAQEELNHIQKMEQLNLFLAVLVLSLGFWVIVYKFQSIPGLPS